MSKHKKHIKLLDSVIDLTLVIQRTIANRTGISYSLVNMTIHGIRTNERTKLKVLRAIKEYFPASIIVLKEAA